MRGSTTHIQVLKMGQSPTTKGLISKAVKMVKSSQSGLVKAIRLKDLDSDSVIDLREKQRVDRIREKYGVFMVNKSQQKLLKKKSQKSSYASLVRRSLDTEMQKKRMNQTPQKKGWTLKQSLTNSIRNNSEGSTNVNQNFTEMVKLRSRNTSCLGSRNKSIISKAENSLILATEQLVLRGINPDRIMFLEQYSASLKKTAKIRKTIWRIKKHLLTKGYEAYFDYCNFNKIEHLTLVPNRFDSPLPETPNVDISLSLLDIRSVTKTPSTLKYKERYRIISPNSEDNQAKHLKAVNNEIKGISSLAQVKEKPECIDHTFNPICKQKTNIQKNFVKTLITKGTIQKRSRNHNRKTLSKASPFGSSMGAKPPLNYTVLLTGKSSFNQTRELNHSQFKKYSDFKENQLLAKAKQKYQLSRDRYNPSSHKVLMQKGIQTIKHKKTILKIWPKSKFSNYSFNMKDIRTTSMDNLQGDKGSTRKLKNWRSYSEFKSIALQKNGKNLEGSLHVPHSKISNVRSAFKKSMAKSIFSSKKNILGGRRGVVQK
ncbi:unnamed protein product [Moneuplotes crassus]|uniref:Uncharacterized protein n=1 Tax=Euplotes crassus TaxID=5936 RepID=A0AAD2D4U0_EUPCR|nr:unnamed protein product [Moneuplotes crassus]